MKRLPIIIIAGPTASGKSSLALTLAKTLDGAIINGDSMQLYKDLPILSACPTEEDYTMCEHLLYQKLDAAERCSAGEWLEMAEHAIHSIRASQKTPIIVGGTGLYLSALINGLAPIPPIPDEIKQKVEKALSPMSPEEAHDFLMEKDPESAKTLAANQMPRIRRALEILEATGISQKEWQKRPHCLRFQRNEMTVITLSPEREYLYERCNQRFDQMLELGGLEEMQSLMQHYSDLSHLPILRVLGARELYEHIKGRLSLDLAKETAKQHTRRYAKRQLTWFRHQIASDHILEDINAEKLAIELKKTLYH